MSHKVFRDSDSEDEVDEEFDSDGSFNEENDVIAEDSDSAPEDVDFTESKLTALQRVRDALKQIGETKDKKRQKRRKIDEIYSEQKKQKIKALEDRKLPTELLEDLCKAQSPAKTTIAASDNSNDSAVEDRLVDEPAPSGDEDFPETAEDFIPLSTDSNIKAVYIPEVRAESSIEKAKAFRQSKMYGGSVPRESVHRKIAKKTKRKAQFC